MEREWRDRAKATSLLEQAEFQGYLTTDDIFEAFPRAVYRASDFRRVIAFLHNAGVEVCAGSPPTPPPPR
jgi:hypothetical protein